MVAIKEAQACLDKADSMRVFRRQCLVTAIIEIIGIIMGRKEPRITATYFHGQIEQPCHSMQMPKKITSVAQTLQEDSMGPLLRPVDDRSGRLYMA